MKVTGPSSGAPGAAPSAGRGVDGAQGAESAEGAKRAEGTAEPAARSESSGQAFAEKLGGAPPAAPGAVQRQAAPATADLAAELQAGRLQPKAAIEKLLEQVLARQVGADAPPAVREKVRAALQETLENDPLLAEKLRSLEG